MGFFIGIVSVFVGDVDMQDTLLLRHGGDAIVHGQSLPVLAVDAEVAAVGNIQLHIVDGHEAQRQQNAVARSDTRQRVAHRTHDTLRQRETQLAGMALAMIGEQQRIVARLVLGHGGTYLGL